MRWAKEWSEFQGLADGKYNEGNYYSSGVSLIVLMLGSTFSPHETSQILCQNAIRSWENQHSAVEQ